MFRPTDYSYAVLEPFVRIASTTKYYIRLINRCVCPKQSLYGNLCLYGDVSLNRVCVTMRCCIVFLQIHIFYPVQLITQLCNLHLAKPMFSFAFVVIILPMYVVIESHFPNLFDTSFRDKSIFLRSDTKILLRSLISLIAVRIGEVDILRNRLVDVEMRENLCFI